MRRKKCTLSKGDNAKPQKAWKTEMLNKRQLKSKRCKKKDQNKNKKTRSFQRHLVSCRRIAARSAIRRLRLLHTRRQQSECSSKQNRKEQKETERSFS
jgi:hypothetical protein